MSIIKRSSLASLMLAVLATSLLISSSTVASHPLTTLSVPPSQTPTATPQTHTSLFENDPCSPPCWFGLIPGESSAEDVWTFLQTNEELFEWIERARYPSYTLDNTGSYITDGDYRLGLAFSLQLDDNDLGRGSSSDGKNIIQITISLEDSIVTKIDMLFNHTIDLDQVLERLGTPDFVQLQPAIEAATSQSFITIIYLESLLLVLLEADTSCLVSEMGGQFTVSYASYRTPTEPNQPISIDEFEQIFAPYVYGSNLPLGTWQSMLNHEVQGICRDVFADFLTTTPTPPPSMTPWTCPV